MTSLTYAHDNLTIGAARRLLVAFFTTTDSRALTFLRIVLGVSFIPHGLQKTAGWFGGYGFDGTMGWFASVGIPPLLGFLAIAAETVGAIALVAGLGTRLAAFGVGAVVTTGALMIHLPHGFFMNWSGTQAGEGFEYHILAAAIALVLIAGGAGRYSLDRLLARRIR